MHGMDTWQKGFSNWSAHSVTVWGQTWKTAEHAIQASKFKGLKREHIASRPSAFTAACAGRARAGEPLRADWEQVRDGLVLEVVRAKFQQHPELASLLLATGTEPIAEPGRANHWRGPGGKMGEILIAVRSEIKELQWNEQT